MTMKKNGKYFFVLLRGLLAGAAVNAASLFSQSLLPADPLEGMLGGLADKGVQVAVEGQAFSKAVRVRVADKPKNHWDVQFIFKSVAAIPAGAPLSLKLSARSLNGEGHILAFLKDKAGQTLIREDLKPGAAWKEFSLSGTAKSAYEKGDLSLVVTFGFQTQEIEVGGLSLVSGASSESTTAAKPAANPPQTDKPASAQTGDVFSPLPKDQRRFAIFKWDDLRSSGKGVHERFQKVADFVAEKKIHASLGVICNSLEEENAGYYEWIRSRAVENGGPFEFWLHGYTHMMSQSNGKPYTEFSGPPYEEQKKNFSRACEVTKEKTGLTIRSFGSAGNSWDDTCIQVMKEFPEVKIWLFGEARGKSDKFLIPRLVELERAPGRADYANFLKGYAKQRTSEALLMQGHPAMWTDEAFEEFKKVYELLAREGWEFVTPYEYYQYKTGSK
ncbi:MAG: hypothetical protein JNM63_19350 [Spirochaetia bacterium]|nr:hypothetical protein [Spirochaetia bacterium]